MDSKRAIETLIQDNPSLHFVSESVAQENEFIGLKPGLTSWAVRPEILNKLAQIVQPEQRTLETGGGQTTVAFAALADHHICVNPDVEGCNLIADYLQKLAIPTERIDFVYESSEIGLAKLDCQGQIDVAFIDGCHGFPFPAIDWHYIDRFLKVGGILGVDDINIPSVSVLCHFLEANGTYTLEDTVLDTAFYRKIYDEKDREWPFQKFNSTYLEKINQEKLQQDSRWRFWPWRRNRKMSKLS
jgi:hypothetical protein